jgi:hypothetical protein
LAAAGSLVWSNYSPEIAYRFLQDVLDLAPPRGRLSGRADYRFALGDEGPEVLVERLQLELRDLLLSRPGAERPLVGLASITVEDGRFELDGKRIDVGRLRVADGSVRAVRRDTLLDWQGIVAGDYASGEPERPAAPAAAAGSAWGLRLAEATIEDVALRFEDQDRARTVVMGAERFGAQFGIELHGSAEGLSGGLDGLDVVLDHVSVGTDGNAQPLFALQRLQLDDGAVDLAGSRVSVASLRLQGGEGELVLEDDGRLNWQHLLDLRSGLPPEASPAEPAGDAVWQVAVASVALEDFAADLVDRTPSEPVTLRVEPASLQIDELTLPPSKPLRVAGEARLVQGGALAFDGNVDAARSAARLDVRVTDLTLLPLQTYLAGLARVELDSGRASANLAIGYGEKAPGALEVNGEARVDDLHVVETATGETLLGWRQMLLEAIAFDSPEHTLTVKEVVLEQPAGKFIIHADQSNNWQQALVERRGALPEPATPAEPAAAMAAEVGRVRVRDGALNFGDLSLPSPFATDIHQLEGSISGLSTAPESRAVVDLAGRVNEYGTATIAGELAPFDAAAYTDLGVRFENLDLPRLTPYSAKFAGYRIDSGKLSLDLAYRVQQSQLQGDNQILIDRLTLGEKIESPDAIDAPIELAIALMEDANGRIDLGLPVSGDLSDPQFSYGHLIWKALGNLITKVVTAPFRALAGAFGIEGENHDSITFAAGTAELPPPEREKLKAVASMLTERPRLSIAVQGQFSEALDGEAMRRDALARVLLERQGIRLDAGERPGKVSLTDRATRKALEALAVERLGAERVATLKAEAEKPPAQGKPVDGDPLYRRLYESLLAVQPLAEGALTRLARARAQAVAAWLEAEGGLGGDRLAMDDPLPVEGAEDAIVGAKLNLQAGG